MRVVIADDELLLREGLARLLEEIGIDVAATAATPSDLLRSVEELAPDVAIVDIRMPPTRTDEGIVAAEAIGQRFPDVGVLVLSHYLDLRFALRLLESHPARVGYLLKERVSDLAVLADALQRIDENECVLDPTIVMRLMQRRREPDTLAPLIRAGARGSRAYRGGALEHCDRTATRRDRQDRRGPYPKHLRKARTGRGG